LSQPENERQEPGLRLLPHQANFVETVFSPSSKRIILLEAAVGLGKSAATVGVASRLLRERPMGRGLFLVPAALRSQFSAMLRAANVPSVVVDRYMYREMLDATAAREIWPTGKVAILSFDFAFQPDVQDSLSACQWDIVLVDEWHLTRGVRSESLRHITASAEKIVLVTATAPDMELSRFAAGDVTGVKWRRDLVVDASGKPLPTLPQMIFHEIPVDLSAAELELRGRISELVKVLLGGVGGNVWPKMLLRHVESSPAAIEVPLQRIKEKVATILDSAEEALNRDDAASGDIPTDSLDRSKAEQAAELAERALQEIEAIGSDSKLNTFGSLLTRIEQGTVHRRILVLTDFRATLFYVAAEIEERGLACQFLHGSMDTDDRARSFESFSSAGGILVATRSAIEGLDGRGVTDLVLYDVPRTQAALRKVLSRFDRFGRVSELSVYFFVQSDSDDPTQGPRGRLAEIIRSGLGESTPQ